MAILHVWNANYGYFSHRQLSRGTIKSDCGDNSIDGTKNQCETIF